MRFVLIDIGTDIIKYTLFFDNKIIEEGTIKLECDDIPSNINYLSINLKSILKELKPSLVIIVNDDDVISNRLSGVCINSSFEVVLKNIQLVNRKSITKYLPTLLR